MSMYLNQTSMNKSILISVIRSLVQIKNQFWLKYKQNTELKSILASQSLTTYFQPIVDLTSGDCLGYELLNRPPVSTTFPSPDTFYSFIADTEQIDAVEKLCRHLSLERFSTNLKKKQQPRESLIFLNIHPSTLIHRDTNGDLLDLLHRCELSPQQVVLEITEKSAVAIDEKMHEVLLRYRNQGMKIALDDTGSGYNSLKTFISLKPDFMKLDRSLIQSIDKDQTKQHLVTLLVDLSSKTNSTIIAEGLERIEEVTFLKEIGVSIGQGYVLGKPSQQLMNATLP